MHRTILPLLLAAGLSAGAAAAAPQPQYVPTPRAAPIPISATNRPFLAADRALAPVDLAARGYVEEEYLVSGRSNIYDWGATPRDGVVVRTPRVGWATRMLVRRPQDAARFSGRVVVELLNPTGLYDFAPLWGFSWEHFLRRGDVWVGLTVKPVAARTLQRFDPVRYASLSFTFEQPASCRTAAGNAGAAGAADGRANLPDAENGVAWDLIAQVGALLRSASKENPLAAFHPDRIIAAGYSQTGGYVTTFANALHARSRLVGGRPVFDGYLNAAGASAAPINQCAAPLPETDPRRAALPRDVPFIAVMTQSDFNRAPHPGRADSDATGDVFRLYEIAGAAHSGPFPAGQPATTDLAIAGFEAPAEGLCREARSDFPLGYAFNAIWQQLEDLLVKGEPMSSVPRIETGASAAPLLDEHGNARGGWRLPQIDVPLAAYGGRSTPAAGDARSRNVCELTGSMKRYDQAHLKRLYKDRNSYLRRFNAAVDEAVADRRIVAEDAAALKAPLVRTLPAF